jgi:glycosyltransferase involved in cell wall biosynthesis
MPILEKHGIEHRYLMPNGINYEDFFINAKDAVTELQLKEKPLVLYVGRLTEAKGIATLISAMQGIDSAKLIIIGDGKIRAALEKQAEELNIDVIFMGAVAPQEIPLWMSAATVFVLPSLSEGRPTVINEAMASRTVCIASDIAGTRELIIDKKTGFLVAPGDAESFRKRIKSVLDDEKLRNRIEADAYTYLRENVPTWSEVATNYMKLIKGIENNRIR